MSRDHGKRAINLFNGANEQASEAMETKQRFIDPVRTSCEYTGEFPAQEDPDIQQEQTDAEQEKSQGWIARDCGSTYTPPDPRTILPASRF